MKLAHAGFVAAVALLLGVFWLSQRTTDRLVEVAAWKAHTDQVIGEIRGLHTLLVRAETMGRGFVITGRDEFLEPQAAARRGIPTAIARLRRLVADDPEQQRRLDALAPVIQAKLDWMEMLVALRRDEGLEAAAAAVATGEGVRLTDRIGALVGAMEEHERRLLVERERRLGTAVARARGTVLAGAAFGASLLIAAFLGFEREVRRRRASETRYRRLFDAVPVSLWEEDWSDVIAAVGALRKRGVRDLSAYQREHPEFTAQAMRMVKILDVNQGTVEMFRARTKEAMLASLETVFPTEDTLAGFGGELVALGDGRPRYDAEMALCTADGDPIHVRLAMRFPDDGSESGRVLVSRMDVSDRVRLEEDRRQLFDLSRDLICVCGFDGVFRQANPAWERTLGYTAEEMTRTPFLDFVHPEDRAPTMAGFEKLVQRGESVFALENRYRCKDGSFRWLQWSAEPDLDRRLVFAIARDVTEQKQAQDEVRRARDAAEAANSELEAFSYSVSHDLRAPLRSLDGFSQALLEDYGDSLDAEGRDYLQRIRAGAQRMGRLIDDMLLLARISRTELATEPVDVSALARLVAEEVRAREPQRETVVSVEDGLRGQADARLLRLAVENLIGNAFKFTRKRQKARIEVGAEDGNGGRIFFVRDNGAGFDMAYAHKLFGAFQRLHSGRDFEGTGIGLATVARVIRRHGGRIWAQAAPEQGATFYFTLGDERPGELQEA